MPAIESIKKRYRITKIEEQLSPIPGNPGVTEKTLLVTGQAVSTDPVAPPPSQPVTWSYEPAEAEAMAEFFVVGETYEQGFTRVPAEAA